VRQLIAGNWKMNGLTAQLGEVEAIAASVTAKPPLADVLICTTATLIARAVQIVAGRIGIGGQDCHSAIAGAFTGDISAEMLKDAGASSVIVGHSERRRAHGTTGYHLHRRDAITAQRRQRIVRVRRSDRRQIVQMHTHIRHCLEARLGAEGKAVRILYGGSVKPSNAREILALPEVGGALIGNASLKATDLEDIIRAVSRQAEPSMAA